MEEEEEEDRYCKGHNGDHLIGIPFECGLCHFHNINHCEPSWGDCKDEFTLMCIRRANLDAMWAREPSTVKTNLSRIVRDHRE